MKFPYDVHKTNQIDITNIQLRYVDISINGSRLGPDFINNITHLTIFHPL